MAEKLIPHDGSAEVFVCRNCMVQIDPVGGHYPGWTQQEADDAVCPHCGSPDTAWLFDKYPWSKSSQPPLHKAGGKR